ncbi:hypothetical protein I6I57_08335 [Brevibacterium casei]|uniref:hypothetical protein n=1 Tax=Brevibacterium casei TaxID=33889 RepID=UPI001918A2B8|nr:hypothetical protein [Brevibacterium casei]QQT70831.1 hypothetical protein I6I57_08335 [Brevibacterium casei]
MLVGSALSVVGTDEVTETEAFEVSDGSYAVVLDQAVVPYSGTDVTIEARNSQGKELFLGTANGVDTDSFLDGVSQVQISDVDFPDQATHRSLPGDPAPAADIAGRDWWTSRETGQSVAKTFDLDADPQMLVIAPAAEGENLDGTTVQLKMRVEGVLALSLIGLAVAIIFAGFSAYFFLRWWNARIRPRKKEGPGTPSDEAGDGTRGRTKTTMTDRAKAAVKGRSKPESKADAEPETQPATDAAPPTEGEPPRRRSRRGARTRAATALTLTTGLALSGCAALPVAQPHTPNVTPYERTAVRSGEAGDFMTAYTESLDKILADKGEGLESIQGAPLIDRTRAQIQIAEKTKQKLRAPNFTEVVAGGPSFEQYPMWFYALGTTDGDEKLTQVQLATRESASTQPIVRSAVFIPADQAPTLLADANGAVEVAPKAFSESMTTSADEVASYLADGKPDKVKGLDQGGFKSFRDYLGGLRDKDSGFDEVNAECKPYTEFDFASMTLTTEQGALGMGEVRCTLTIKVPEDYSLDLGDTIEAVKTNDKDGNTVKVDTAQPYVIMQNGEELTAVASDWDILSSRIE